MSDEKTIVRSGDIVTVAYPDLLKPALSEVGSVLGRVVRMALAPVRGLVWSLEQLEERVSKDVEDKLRNVPPERLVFPDPTVIVPALMALSYSMDKERLRDMYTTLLATSMDGATAADVHPSFVEVVKQLTPDEARLLTVLKEEMVFFYDVYAFHPGLKGSSPEKVGVTDLFDRARCEDRARGDVAISNLERQGLALFEPQGTQEPSTLNETEVLRPYFDSIRARGLQPTAATRLFRLTAFGRSFCACCVETTTTDSPGQEHPTTD